MKLIVMFILSMLALDAVSVNKRTEVLIPVVSCNTEGFCNECVTKLNPAFNFVKSYKIDGEGGSRKKVEYSYVFTKGTTYLVNVCTPPSDADRIVVTLYDASRNQVATNHIGKEVANAMAYSCNVTGIFYIEYTFDGASTFCGGSTLGFKR